MRAHSPRLRVTTIDPSEWPTSETRPIAVLALDPEDIEKRFSLKFHEDRDDLDSLRLSVIRLPSGRMIGLVRYDRSPDPGTTLFADQDAEPEKEQTEFLEVFGLTPDSFSWRLGE